MICLLRHKPLFKRLGYSVCLCKHDLLTLATSLYSSGDLRDFSIYKTSILQKTYFQDYYHYSSGFKLLETSNSLRIYISDERLQTIIMQAFHMSHFRKISITSRILELDWIKAYDFWTKKKSFMLKKPS